MTSRIERFDTAGSSKETPQKKVEVLFADIEKDAPAIAELYDQHSAIEHLAGIAPSNPPPEIDVGKYRLKRPSYNIIVASPEEVLDLYQRQADKIYVLKTVDEEGNLDGVVAAEKPGIGLLFGNVLKLVVADRSKGQGKGKALARAGTALIVCSRKIGGFESPKVQAAVILGVRGAEVPQGIFRSLGFTSDAERPRNCVSWSVEEGRFIERNVLPFTLIPTPQEVRAMEKFLPQR